MMSGDSPVYTGTAYLDNAGTIPANLSAYTSFTFNVINTLTDTVYYTTSTITILNASAGIFSLTFPANTLVTVAQYYTQLVAVNSGSNTVTTFGVKPTAPALAIKGIYSQ